VAVKGMMHVVDACRARQIRELLVVSSSEVYQDPVQVPTPETVPLTIADPLNPRYSYAGGKIISELLALHTAATFCERVLIVRPHNVYGPDMGNEHVIPQLVRRILLSKTSASGRVPLTIQGTGQETRSFMHIDDCINGLMTVVERGIHRTIYNIGNSQEMAIADLARQIASLLGRTVEIRPGERASGSPTRRCPDISKIAALGYSPRVPFADGLAETVMWYADHPLAAQ